MAKCQLFSFQHGLREVVPGGLFMQSVVGETMSVGVVKYVEAGASGIATKAHAHGEEASFQLLGGCALFQGDTVAPPVVEVDMQPGVMVMIPADQEHYGINTYGPAGESVRLNVASPPRAEYGSKAQPTVFTHQAKPATR